MKKILSSALFIVAFGAYVLYQNLGSASANVQSAVTTSTTQTSTGAVTIAQATPATVTSQPPQTAPVSETKPKPTPTQTPAPTPTPAPAPKPKGQYVDGTYTGSVADAYYGNVQVQAVIMGGKLANVSFLQYPNDRSTSVYINSQAMPMLKQEAISAQSANVSGVSGASETSMAFEQSLGSALSQAKA